MTKHSVKNQSTGEISNQSVHQIGEASYRALFEYAPDGILIADAQSYYLDANPSICNMLGYTRDELIGMHATDIVVQSEVPHIQSALDIIQTKSDYTREWLLRRKDGSVFSAEIMATTMPDGSLLGLIRDITVLKEQQREISQLSRLYAALTKINQAIIWLPTREELFKRVCQILVNEGGFQMAWINWHDSKTQQLTPVASWGEHCDYFNNIKIYVDSKRADKRPINLAFSTGEPYICNNMLEDPARQTWCDDLVRLGFRALAAFPIQAKDKVSGILSVYTNQTLFFHDKEIALLAEAAGNISFSLENLEREEKRKEAEINAKNESLFSDMMIESMPGILYFYNYEGRFLRWNHNFQSVSGYTNREITKMHPLDFFAPEEKAAVANKISEVFTKGQAFVEASLLSKDGKKTPYFFTGRNVTFKGTDCLVGMGIDISERKNAELKLNESEQKYGELVESANSIILRWNAQGYITFLNSFGLHFFGYAFDQIVGKHVIGTIVPNTDSAGRDLQMLMQQICLDTKVFEQNINENTRSNGERVWISWTNKVVLDGQGHVVEILSIGNDITERLLAEQEIRELNASLEKRVTERTEELQTALIRAEAADKIKSAFLATMSHELRTPLNSIIGFTGIILQGLAGPLNNEQTKQLGMVRGSARHLLELINDVLDISKIEAGQLEVNSETFNLVALIERVVNSLTPMIEKKGLVLHTSISKELGEIVSDRRRLEQILINLVNNAAKFTEKGSITITAEIVNDLKDSLDTTPTRFLKLSVIDTGIGIKPDDLDLLFKPFHQIDSGLSRLHEGTGLGLAICRRLLELMGGQIYAVSEWSTGSKFTVLLPMGTEVKS
ncbi:PAS domain S-box protein [Methylotenera mobilis]|uniref:Virulence sensor protein BvgS n=1 Tax=Methylotenera mobilis (strain JLW8 / ATCC BAA-1282 / DSM 17540) TaxID=583345 RepID=C6WW32_METML|nr:PAS domain S-box protein [Methylotenera mobilis]ACT48131.1 multi-sensor signal transduction histidine kinase [Methylotenera mobilis JLW8]